MSQLEVICQRSHALSILFSNEPKLLRFFVETSRHVVEEDDIQSFLNYASSRLDQDDVNLCRLAADIWCGVRVSRTMDVMLNTKASNLEAIGLAVSHLRSTRGCECPQCVSRYKHFQFPLQSFLFSASV